MINIKVYYFISIRIAFTINITFVTVEKYYMINIAICDDNIVFLKRFTDVVDKCMRKYTDDFCLNSISNGDLLLAKQKEMKYDVIFLDIDMPDLSGFDVARIIRNDFSRCFIIFITNHSELVYESMDFQPFNFIRKNCGIPIEESTEKVISKLMCHMKQNEKIVLEDEISGRNAVYIRDITYIESDRHYVLYYILKKDLPIKIRSNIGELEKKFSAYDFIRIHKKYLVNLRFLSDIDSKRNEIVLGVIHKKLPMSKNYKKYVDEKYTLFLRSMI